MAPPAIWSGSECPLMRFNGRRLNGQRNLDVLNMICGVCPIIPATNLKPSSKTEVTGLLEDISKAGIASGLEFELFAPQQEVQHEFYSELPIRMSVLGHYHQIGDFISRIAALDRIVTLHDFSIEPTKTKLKNKTLNKSASNKRSQSKNVENLTMNIVAKTYRYSEDDVE